MYFVAAVGAGLGVADAQEQVVQNYWWILPRETSQSAQSGSAQSVIRIIGEKGSAYEELYPLDPNEDARHDAAVRHARVMRQVALRREAMKLVRKLRAEGKSPKDAYVEAWATVYARYWLCANRGVGSSAVEDMLTCLAASESGEITMTPEEEQWLLEALLEDDDRLDSKEGQALLRNLVRRLREQGYGQLDVTRFILDERMLRFADAMKHGLNSMAAYRDALFKTNRDSIVRHQLIGYYAPLSMGLGSDRLMYRQTAPKVTTTLGSANTLFTRKAKPQRAAGMNANAGALENFLAEAPPQSTEQGTNEEQGENDRHATGAGAGETIAAAEPPHTEASDTGRPYFMCSVASAAWVTSTKSGEASGNLTSGSGSGGLLTWNSVSGKPSVWDNGQTAVWIDGSGAAVAYADAAHVEFGAGANLNKKVEIAAEGVVAGSVSITGDRYHFSGGHLTVKEGLTAQGGVLELDSNVTIDIGDNRITGGELENVKMVVTGEISRPVTDDSVTVHNLITSADGDKPGTLKNVNLHAGTASEYATLHNIAFDGTSKLMGYVTFEKTQAPEKISVVDGGELTLENLTFDLRGLAMGTKTLIAGGNVDTLKNWDAEHVQFVYSGVQVNSAAVDLTQGEGVLVLSFEHEGNLYWTGATDKMWDTSSANWSSSATSGATSEAFSALSNVYFGDGGNAANRVITVTRDMVVAKLGVTAGGYSFSGARVAVLGDATLKPGAGAVTFNDQLVVQGNLTTGGDGEVSLLGATHIVGDATFSSLTTTIAGDMIVDGTLNVTSGNLKISGNVAAEEMVFEVNSDAASVEVSGNLTVGTGDDDVGLITIGGSAKQQFSGTVTAKGLIVNGGDVYFSRLQVDSLTVGKDATVHVQTSSDSVAVSSSVFPEISLSGTLALDAPGGATYNHKYDVHVQDDAARLVFGSGCTIDNLQLFGKQDASGYTNVEIDVESSSATVTKMQDLGNLKVDTGSLTVKNASGAVHGALILDNAKLKLGEKSGNIMADDSGAVELKNGARLDIGTTTQTLSANNVVSLSGTSSITGEAGGVLLTGSGLCVNYAGNGNSIDAKLSVNEDISLNSTRGGSSLELAGIITGSGTITLNGTTAAETATGKVVISGANAGFTGKVIVEQGATLTLQNTDSLSSASVVLNPGGTLNLDAPGVVNLKALTLQSGSILAISSIVGTNDASSADAVLNIKDGSLELDNVVLNLNFSQELKAMTTYNIMTGVSSSNNLSFNVQHNGVDLHSSQYKIEHKNDLLSIYVYTMTGNVWDGGTGSETGYWSKTNTDNNWTTGNGNAGGNYNEDGEYKAAIFGDLNAGTSNVCLSGNVEPGDIYFTAESTVYTLSDEAGGSLAAGTHIHKLNEADVTLALGNNATLGAALGNVDIQDGTLILSKALAVNGAVTVDAGAKLEVKPGTDGLILANYKASANAANKSATLSGVTMDAAGIRGTEEAPGSANNLRVQGNAGLSWLELTDFAANVELTDFAANGDVALSHVKLLSSAGASSHVLKNVTIGQEVVVGESASYTLSGAITFDAMLINNGAVTLDGITSVEIGKIAPSGGAAGKYTYQLIGPDPDKTNGTNNVALGGSQTTFTQDHVYINGVNLGVDLVKGMVTGFEYVGNGSFTLSIGKEKEDGTIDGNFYIPQWDERWGKTEMAPAFSRLYVGDSADAKVELAADEEYKYSSIVKETYADKVNGGNAISVTLGSGAEGYYVAGGHLEWLGAAAADHEVWIYDISKVKNVVGGLASWYPSAQTAATHVLVNSDAFIKNPVLDPDKDLAHQKSKIWAKHFIIGGSRWVDQHGESFVTVQDGQIYNIFGGSCGGYYNIDDPSTFAWRQHSAVTQYGSAHVYVYGGTIGEIFAAGYRNDLIATAGQTRAVEMVLTGGTLGGPDLRVFGGTSHGTVKGDIYVRMEGSAWIKSRLVGGSNAGTVNGNIVLDLISGKAFRVDAAGLGWRNEWIENGELVVDYQPAKIDGDVQVNLYRAFKLGIGEEADLKSGIYGGKETTNHVELIGDEPHASILHFAEAGIYELGYDDSDGWATTESHYVTGFDVFSLEDKAHAVLSLGYFDIDMQPEDPDDERYPDTLIIQGKGVVEVIGRGANFERDIELRTANPDETDASLQKGATLKISTCDIGTVGNGDVRTITATDGTTVDFTGFSITGLDPATPGKAGLDFNVKICGNGVDGKGALYMGQSTQTSNDTNNNVNEIYLPHVELTDNASVKVVAQEALYMDSVKLAGYTLTKLGSGDFITRSVEKVDEKTTGTILVQQGSFGFAQGNTAAETDVVLAAGAELKLNATALGKTNLTLRSLNGAGTVNLNGSTLTLKTVEGSAYYEEYMDEKQSYDQFLGTTGFGYALFSGLISDGSAAGSFVKDGSGVHYISGSSNSYTGGTQLQAGRLYLLGTGAASEFIKDSSKVAAGAAGTGEIVWNSAGAELYLGHGTHIYNNGTASGQGAVMTIGVEGALKDKLADFVGIHSQKGTPVIRDGVEYVEIDTHNLKSIAVDALYADGTAYEAGKDIDRNKMLLVKASDWATAKDKPVTCLSASGYNEATYSGELSGATGLHKVGLGTLDLDQTNTYTGRTEVAKGTLRLRGWGTVGSDVVQVKDASSLMLAYTGSYDDEISSLANNINLSGTGDAQWTTHDSTSHQTAALISAVGQAVTFTLSGDIEGDGGVLHSGEGTLVLNGDDSSYKGGTVITRGVVEVQSAKGLGSTAEGQSAVVLNAAADLHLTVEDPASTEKQLVTKLASAGDDIQGDVRVTGNKNATERVLHMADNGYNAASTTLDEKGTFLLCGTPIDGAGIHSHSAELTGSGTVVVSDATGSGTTATFETIVDYTGDFRVEGNKASVQVNYSNYSDGSIHVAGQKASVQIGGNVSIAAGESLHLRSLAGNEGAAPAVLVSGGVVSVAADAVLSVSNAATDYQYDLSNLSQLQADVSLEPEMILGAKSTTTAYTPISTDITYAGRFDASIAANKQAVGAVQAAGGLTLAGGATYETNNGHTSLKGGALVLDVMEGHQLTFKTTWNGALDTYQQVVLFSDVSSVRFGLDGEVAGKDNPGIYYTQAERYITGSDYVDSQTLLVYDSEAGVVYLQLSVPEPTTSTLSLLALTALCARRRRK